MQPLPLHELVSALIHGIGALIFIILNIILISTAVQTKSKRKIVGSSIFGGAVLCVYFFSTIFHAVPTDSVKNILDQFDYISIFLLIAGSYTPFLLIHFKDEERNLSTLGKKSLGFIWLIAVMGITCDVIFGSILPSFISYILFLVLGWFGIFIIKSVIKNIPKKILWLILTGCLIYSAGVGFYIPKSIPFFHAIWHSFVLIATLVHWRAVYLSVSHSEK